MAHDNVERACLIVYTTTKNNNEPMKYYIIPADCHLGWTHRVVDSPVLADSIRAQLERLSGFEWLIQTDPIKPI